MSLASKNPSLKYSFSKMQLAQNPGEGSYVFLSLYF